MPLRIVVREDRPNLYIRGTVRGQSVFESTETSDRKIADQIRIKRERELLEESVHGRRHVVTFEEAADAYIAAGGPTRFLARVSKVDGTAKGLVVHFRGRRLKDITQAALDAAAHALYPGTTPETRNRQCHTPFIAVWNYAAKQG